MYAIYESKADQLSLFDDGEEDWIDLNEAEELLRQLQADDPSEFERIANLRDGIRAAMAAETKGLFAFCQAGRYQQLFLVDGQGEVVSREVPRVLSAIRCTSDTPGAALPAGYNQAVMRVKRRFDDEVKHRQAQRDHTLSLTQAQRYVLRELRVQFDRATDDDLRGQISILERAFRQPLSPAVNRELNLLRRNGVSGDALLQNLSRIYDQHNMREWLDRRVAAAVEDDVPRIICSEGLV
jgi:hypothetical protein